MAAQNPQPKATSTNPKEEASKAVEDKSQEELDLMEEDDEFEEFTIEQWSGQLEDADDVKLFGANWDDEDIDDQFLTHLRAELKKSGGSAGVSKPAQKTAAK